MGMQADVLLILLGGHSCQPHRVGSEYNIPNRVLQTRDRSQRQVMACTMDAQGRQACSLWTVSISTCAP